LSFYLWNAIYVILSLFLYVYFRCGVSDYLRFRKKSRSFLRKNKKGLRNYWLYEKIHAEIDLGYVYYLNLLLLAFTLLYSILTVTLGWLRPLSLTIAVCGALLCALQIVAVIFSNVYYNLVNYGKAFVVIAKDINPFNRNALGLHSSLFTVLEIGGLLTFAIYSFFLVP